MINNFAVGGGVIKSSDNGYFNFYNSNISNNMAYYASVGELFDSRTSSLISN